METFKHQVPLQLRFNDADSLGHVNNSVYFSFYDLGKTEYFKSLRGSSFFEQEIDIVVAHAEVDFIEPVFLKNNVSVRTKVTHVGNKSFDLLQEIFDNDTKVVKCKCVTTMVGFDFKTNKTIRISDLWRELIAKFEGVV